MNLKIDCESNSEKIIAMMCRANALKSQTGTTVIFEVSIRNDETCGMSIVPMQVTDYIGDQVEVVQANGMIKHINMSRLQDGEIFWCPNFRSIYGTGRNLDERIKSLISYKRPTKKENLKRFEKELHS